jgi:hypothetical protein
VRESSSGIQNKKHLAASANPEIQNGDASYIANGEWYCWLNLDSSKDWIGTVMACYSCHIFFLLSYFEKIVTCDCFGLLFNQFISIIIVLVTRRLINMMCSQSKNNQPITPKLSICKPLYLHGTLSFSFSFTMPNSTRDETNFLLTLL